MNPPGIASQGVVATLPGEMPVDEAGAELLRQNAAAALVYSEEVTFSGCITTETILQAMLEKKSGVPISALCSTDVRHIQTEEWLSLNEEEVERLYYDRGTTCILFAGDKP